MKIESDKLLKKAKEIEEEIVRYRRKIHKNPELKYEEHATAALVAEKLEKFGIEVKRNVGDLNEIKKELESLGEEPTEETSPTGVVGILKGEDGTEKTIALRADMDALPLTETKDSSHIPVKEGFRSENEEIMHACGHDAHVAMLLGAAKILSEKKNKLNGTVKFVFQPAEEGGNGAKIIRKTGILDDVDAIFGIHVWTNLDSGTVQINDRSMLASADIIELTIKGGGGHGSAPHETTDPLSTSVDLINSLYKMADREIDTSSPSVISITQLNSGTTWNVIPSEAKMRGTIRTFDKEVREKIISRIREIGESLTSLHDLDFTFVDKYLCPPTFNTEREAKMARSVAKELFGEENVIKEKPDMGAEDFAYYLEKIPGCFIFLGTSNKEKGTDSPAHNPKFDVDEEVLYKGSALYAGIALEYLGS